MSSLYDIEVTDIDGRKRTMSEFRGKTLLIVNVASKCGFTPQYEGLEKLYKENAGKGLAVLGFPCDQFGHQEPGNEEEIKNFCSLNYDVSFPMFSKVDVNGPFTHPLFANLKKAAKGVMGTESIKWNFTKFLVDKDGKVVRRYAPTDTPASIGKDLAKLL